MIAALYVDPTGPYVGREDVDPWTEERDARLYEGPYPVVAHPPCKRWGRYWSGGPSAKRRYRLGDDGGCFEASLLAVERWGGVLEHPEASHAWGTFCLPIPPRSGGWVQGIRGGWSCCVEQGHYGHEARKATWLYAVGCDLPELAWGPAEGKARLDDGYHSAEERRAAAGRKTRCGPEGRLSKRARLLTPQPFADLLLSLARSAR